MPITLDGTGSITGLTATGISAVQNLPATGTITNLTTTTISDGTNSTSSTNVIKGSAKAWVNFNGTGTVAIRSSFNVSSITDNGTGDYTVNFTTVMPNTNYVITGSSRQGDNTVRGGSTFGTTGQTIANTYMTTGARVAVFYPPDGSAFDAVVVTVAVFSS